MCTRVCFILYPVRYCTPIVLCYCHNISPPTKYLYYQNYIYIMCTIIYIYLLIRYQSVWSIFRIRLRNQVELYIDCQHFDLACAGIHCYNNIYIQKKMSK